jgi:DNA-binding MarR family transcriptional regulator
VNSDGETSLKHVRTAKRLTASELQRLSEFRFQMRRFLHFSQEAAEKVGLRAQQYQLLLAVFGMPDGVAPTIAAVAARLLLKHNSTVELVDRTIEQGLLRRMHDPVDQRRILLRLTERGEQLLHSLAAFHKEEINATGPELLRSLRMVLHAGESPIGPHKGARSRDGAAV